MKMKVLLILVSVLLIGCGKKRVEVQQYYEYSVINASDHVITMQVEELYDYDDVFPDELTLPSGENFYWESPRIGLGRTEPFPFWANKVTVTFDNAYEVSYGREEGPLAGENYVVEDRGKHELPLATYTFTNADYEYAVENGAVE